MNISLQKEKTLPNWAIKKNISFGNTLESPNFKKTIANGETYVVINKNLYFNEFSPDKILKNCNLPNIKDQPPQEQEIMKKYFLPFRRLSQISNKNTENIDGCKIVTTAPEACFNKIQELTTLERKKRALFWLPSIIIADESKQIKIHNKTQYETAQSTLTIDKNRTLLQKITNNLINIIKKEHKSNLVIAIGNKEEDLAYVDPFKRLNLNSNKKNSFDIIKDIPFRSIFICDENTSIDLKYKLAKLEALCNFDKQLRFIVINTDKNTTTNKIVEAILLMQRNYANYNETFRDNITKKLKKLLEHKKLDFPTNINHPSQWVDAENFKPINFKELTKEFLKNNKISTALLLTAIIVPIYTKYFYNSSNKK